MGEFEAAYGMLDRVMPQVLECEDAELNARCFRALAECQMGMAGKAGGETRVGGLHRAVEMVDRAFVEFGRVGDREAMMEVVSMKARIRDFLGERSLRDEAVMLWRMLQKGE